MILEAGTIRLSIGNISMHSENVAEKVCSAIYTAGIVCQRHDKQETAVPGRQQTLDPNLCAKMKSNQHRLWRKQQTYKRQHAMPSSPGVNRVGHREATIGKRYNNSDRQASLLQMLPSVLSSRCADVKSSTDPPCAHRASNEAARRCNETIATLTRSICASCKKTRLRMDSLSLKYTILQLCDVL